MAIRLEKPGSVPGSAMKKIPVAIQSRSSTLLRRSRGTIAWVEFTCPFFMLASTL